MGTGSLPQEREWKRLLEVVVPGRQHVVAQITTMMVGLGLQPAQAARAGQAAMAALDQALRPVGRDGPDSTVIVRVWVADEAMDPWQPPGPLHADKQESRGWSFFVVRRREEDPMAGAEQERHLIDLYLYGEK